MPDRNLNPHKAAVAAMWLWGQQYSNQRGGSMDFWDSRSERDKALAREFVAKIEAAPKEPDA